MATAIPKKYIYNVYQNNQFVGTLGNVINEFSYTQNINTAGAQLEIVLGIKFDDVGAVQTDEFWLDESSNKITDEVGNRIVWSANFNFNNIPIDLGNRIKVYASYDQKPGGGQVFDGIITKWATDYDRNTVTITAMSWGVQLDNYIINTDPTGQQIDQEVYDKEYSPASKAFSANSSPIAQSFNISSPTTVGSIIIYVRAGTGTFVKDQKSGETITPVVFMAWSLYSGTPTAPGALVDSGNISILALDNTTVNRTTLQFTTPQSLNGNYFLKLENQNAGSWYYTDPYIKATSTNPYASGSVYTSTDSGATWTAVAADDLAFIVQTGSGSTQLTFTNQDPSVILGRILDQLNSQGGLITYTTTSIDTTNTRASYPYKVQTILEGVQKILDLCPSGWYWYVDASTNILHLHASPLTVTHRLILGNHIVGLNIEYSLETIVNTVHFSGGPTAGVNLYLVKRDAASANKYGQWLDRMSDNRVTDSTTGTTLAQGEINDKGSPVFHTTVDIHASTYDIETFKLGDIVGFRGFNNLIDTLFFQIASITRYPDHALLQLGTLPPRASGELEDTKRRLDLLETIANPTTPS